MEREIHRLEELLQNKEKNITHLLSHIQMLKKELDNCKNQLNIAQAAAMKVAPAESKAQRELRMVMEAKLASSTQQLL